MKISTKNSGSNILTSSRTTLQACLRKHSAIQYAQTINLLMVGSVVSMDVDAVEYILLCSTEFASEQSTLALCMALQVKIVRESDHKLVRHETGDGFTSVTTFEACGDNLTVVSIIC